ncbi:MAG TPA: thymidine phosphorylase, partial [Steroidobacter sp.]|nr:thymidine phosphorylase [Steroidobacter sp.]
LAKFLAICEAQGGFREPPQAALTADVAAPLEGRITAIDNRRLARIAKLTGAPTSPAAGLETALRVGNTVQHGQPLFTVHAQSRGELAYALEYARINQPFSISTEGA